MVDASAFWFANPGGDFYKGVATQSLRFGVNNYLRNELDTPTSTQNLTLSMWIKRQRVGTEEAIAGVNVDNNYIRFEANGTIRLRDGSINLITTPAYRDASAWYNIVVVWKLADNDSALRVRIYVNGVKQVLGTSTFPDNTTTVSQFNVDGKEHYIGAYRSGGVVGYYSGYIAEVNFIDGITIGETNGYLNEFGELKNGVWIPKDTSGLTFGDNGYRLQFANSAVSTASSSTIGADTSGKNRHFTSAGIVASDCNMPDSPENNFCTLNTLDKSFASSALSEGNLSISAGGGAWNNIVNSTFSLTSGKWYWEAIALTGAGFGKIGVRQDNSLTSASGPSAGASEVYLYGGNKHQGSTSTNSAYYGSDLYGDGNIFGVAIDMDAGKIWVAKNNTYGGSADPTTGNGAMFTNLTEPQSPSFSSYNMPVTFNFGQDGSFAGKLTSGIGTATDANGIGAFKYAPPSGFLALCTGNLTEPDIGPNSDTQATDHFTPYIYTGNGNNPRAFTDVGFQADWIWIKKREGGGSALHMVADSNRGNNKTLLPYANAEETDTDANGTISDVTTLGGFTVNAGSTSDEIVNDTNDKYVAWLWKANGGTATATISESGDNPAASVQANPTAGFSIITYTGTGANGTIAHGLGAVPEVMIFKNRTSGTTDDWIIYHGANTAAPATDHLHLNNTLNTADDATYFNNTKPTNSVLTIGTHVGINTNDETYVAYVFAQIEGYSKFGGYKGNESSDGTFVYTGFRPAFLICKITDGGTTAYYAFFDNKRETHNVKDAVLFNGNELENTSVNDRSVDFLSNGFKLRSSAFRINGDGDNHVYFAWAETPFKYANSV